MSDSVALGACTEMIMGNAFKSSGYITSPDGIRLLRGDNVAPGRIRWDGAMFWPAQEVIKYEQYSLVSISECNSARPVYAHSAVRSSANFSAGVIHLAYAGAYC